MKEKRDFSLKFYYLFNIFMIVLYVTAGIILIFVWHPQELLPEVNRKGIGIVLIAYAAYRSFRLFKKKTEKNSTISTNE
ncbi:MAG: hypothetical protein KA444_08845 [Bacteroidia bacterium]|nr:hypothetical protein [Bacteroidia bacterium]